MSAATATRHNGAGATRTRVAILVLAASLALGGCCPFGYTTRIETRWVKAADGVYGTESVTAEHFCTLQQRRRCASQRLEHCRTLVTESNVAVRNESTGEPITDPGAIAAVHGQCQEMLADPKLAEQACYGDPDKCMREAGFQKRQFELLGCKQLGF
jgi:hypothetical protein